MLDQESIKLIQSSEATNAVADAISEGLARKSGVFCAPDHFTLHDLEKYLPIRRRASGSMTTASTDDFVFYSKEHQEDGASVFIDAEGMKATAVLNLGTNEEPGHADKLAILALKQTAAFKALMQIVSGPKKQQEAAEFLEDWKTYITCLDDVGNEIKISHAVEAFRTITIEAMRKLETQVGNFEESNGTLDSVKASAKQKLPSKIVFKSKPYQDLTDRPFEVRVGVLTSDKPMVQMRIINIEQHQQDMADELASLLASKFDTDLPVQIGVYKKG